MWTEWENYLWIQFIVEVKASPRLYSVVTHCGQCPVVQWSALVSKTNMNVHHIASMAHNTLAQCAVSFLLLSYYAAQTEK